MRIDNNIQKLDTVSAEYIKKVDRPVSNRYNVEEVIEQLRLFHGHVTIQTMFLKGTTGTGEDVNNTGDEFVTPWLEALKRIGPKDVMIYTIDRETPQQTLQKASREELNSIRDRVTALGIPCTASY